MSDHETSKQFGIPRKTLLKYEKLIKQSWVVDLFFSLITLKQITNVMNNFYKHLAHCQMVEGRYFEHFFLSN